MWSRKDFVDLSAELPWLRDGELFLPNPSCPTHQEGLLAHSQEPRLSLNRPTDEPNGVPAMCGRAKLPDDVSEIKLDLKIDFDEIGDYRPRWNAAPTSKLPVVVSNNGERTLTLMRWGLIPSWAKDIKIGYSTFNARAEGVETAPPSAPPGRPAAAASSSPTAITSGATPTNNLSL